MGRTLADDIKELRRLPVAQVWSSYKNDLQPPAATDEARAKIKEELAQFMRMAPNLGPSQYKRKSD